MKNLIGALLAFAFLHGSVKGQAVTPQVINSTGGGFNNSSYIIEWSVGEMAVVTPMYAPPGNVGYVFSNGFLQPFAVFPRQAEKNFNAGDVQIHPNPTRGKTTVQFQVFDQGRMKLFLYDANGQALSSMEFTNTGAPYTQQLDMSGYTNGTYLLHVTLTAGTDPVQVTKGIYKIIKLQ